jgi:branched-chain amino acid transport system substrate-binding protein
MSKYQYLPETIPDPVVGENAYIFPVIQYLNGKSTIVWPEKWKTGELQMKP